MRKKIILSLALICVAAFALVVSSDRASAQFGETRNSWFPRNNPSALSPWLEMQRVSSSELDSYNQFVRPRLDMERYMTAQRREMNRQQDTQKTMQRDISGVRNYQQQKLDYTMQSEASPTGKGATYGNYLHFYPGKK